MIILGVQPNDVTLHTVLSSCAKTKNSEMQKLVLSELQTIEKKQNIFYPRVYEELFLYYVEMKESDKVWQLWESRFEQQTDPKIFKPTHLCIKVVMDVLVELEDLEKMQKVIATSRAMGIRVNIREYGKIVEVLSKRSLFAMEAFVKKLFTEFNEAPDIIIFNHCLNGYSKMDENVKVCIVTFLISKFTYFFFWKSLFKCGMR